MLLSKGRKQGGLRSVSEAPHPRVLPGVVMARVTICFVLECVCVCVCVTRWDLPEDMNQSSPPSSTEFLICVPVNGAERLCLPYCSRTASHHALGICGSLRFLLCTKGSKSLLSRAVGRTQLCTEGLVNNQLFKGSGQCKGGGSCAQGES